MTQLPIDAKQNPGVTPASEHVARATIVMNAPVEAEVEGKQAAAGRPGQLSETIAVACPSAPHPTDEPTIEEYMAALLARNRQAAGTPVLCQRPAPPPPPAPVARKESAPQPAPSSTPVPPAPAPECRTAISELRELANINARLSVNVHHAQRLVLEMHGKRFVAVTAMLASVVLLYLAGSVQSPAYIMAVAAVTTACAFSVQYLALGRELAELCADGGPADRTQH
jgi:hypothetical protein